MALIGAHMSVAGGLFKAFDEAKRLRCEAIQLFTRNQLQWRGKPLTDEECEKFRANAAKSDVKKIISHASYLINLAGEAEVRQKSITALADEIKRCGRLGISEVVLHPGAAGKQDKVAALRKIADGLTVVFSETEEFSNVKILLETMAGQGSVLGAELDELAAIYTGTKENGRIAFCVDSCHVFAAGYDIRSREGYENFMALFDNKLGTDKILCLHLNDSKTDLASRVDRHEHLGRGYIGTGFFSFVMNDIRFSCVPALLETPKSGDGDLKNLGLLRAFRSK